MSLDEQFPIANWPTKSGEYKVVQIFLDGIPHLRFSENTTGGSLSSWEPHAMILEKLLTRKGIQYTTMLSIHEDCYVPPLQGERYQVYGMGKSKINVEQKQASFYGDSFDYGVKINTKHLEVIIPLIPDWKIEEGSSGISASISKNK